MNRTYVRERITTIFLDGKAVDDIDNAHLREGSTLALSAAMPGLVGATMRRGGYYAALRSAITHTETDVAVAGQITTIRIKLFNLLLPELGPELLRRGIMIGAAELADYFAGKPELFRHGSGAALLDGSPVEPETLRTGKTLARGGIVRLSVSFQD
jgi:hypothetical protein